MTQPEQKKAIDLIRKALQHYRDIAFGFRYSGMGEYWKEAKEALELLEELEEEKKTKQLPLPLG